MSETNDTPARPEGEMCPACHRGNLVPWRNGVECPECRYACTPLTPTPPARERGEATPAPASGEEGKVCDLCDTPFTPKDWPNGYRTWYCATCSSPGELRPRLRAAKAEVARLTRELAEAREGAESPCVVCGKALTVATVVRCADCERPFCKPCVLSHFAEHGDRAATAQIGIAELQRQFTAHMERADAERDAARAEVARLREALLPLLSEIHGALYNTCQGSMCCPNGCLADKVEDALRALAGREGA